MKDLAAIRGANGLWLTWTMPKRNVRKLLVNGRLEVTVCRRENTSRPCTQTGPAMYLAPGATGSFSETLPDALASGNPRALYYFVELLDRKGLSTGLSNSVATLAGAAPQAPNGLMAEVTDKGVLLHWARVSPTDDPSGSAIRIHRSQVILMPHSSTGDAAAPPPLPSEESLLIENGSQTGHALDTTVHEGDTYEYTVQRVVRIKLGAQVLELDGQFSAPVTVQDTPH
ncbi:MAG TPA: hypothetical protein VGI45_32985 [Terracidiphilus sp.]